MFDFTKSYSSKSNLVKALKKVFTADEMEIFELVGTDGRWQAVSKAATEVVNSFELTEEELAAQALRPKHEVTFDLTPNEFSAAMILVTHDCLAGMGGERPNDLDGDPYTWVYADTLVKHGWSKEQAAGTFGSLAEKGVIFLDKEGDTITTAAYHYLDTQWDEYKTLEPVKPTAPVSKAEKPTKPAPVKAGKVEAVKQNGLSYPRVGGECWKAWQMFDEIGNVAVAVALIEGVKRGLNDNNIRIELCRWRKFNGFAAVARAKKA